MLTFAMYRKVSFYTTADGKCPVAEFIDSQPAKVAQKKTQKTPKSEIEVCEARMKDFLKRSKENDK